jgi:putative PEP-CTERM system histidine kinase
LWSRNENGQFAFTANWEMAVPEGTDSLGKLPQWLQQSEWIIDLKEWQRAPDIYDNLQLPSFLLEIPRVWLIVPLMFGEQLEGILVLGESDLQPNINWEDRDLLKVAGRQAASHLAQFQADKALVEARQFEAFNRLSAYVVHDLKNILAQQSLIVSNAEKHKDNPAFIEDVVETLHNSVQRMTRLMEQMRSGGRSLERKNVAISGLLQSAVNERQHILPRPTLQCSGEELWVAADREQLLTVFTHIIQNAQEASNKMGSVDVRMLRKGDRAVVEIEDYGVGMDEDFMRNRLFKPFDSTKGLTGMGIGAFESREFVRNLGGDMQVHSTPGIGSLFRIVLPYSTMHEETTPLEKEVSGG